MLYVELSFWLMTPPGPVEIGWRGTQFTVDIGTPWMEAYLGEATDSRATVIHQGPLLDQWQPGDEVAASLAGQDVSVLRRPCKTMLRLTSKPTPARSANCTERAIPRLRADQMVYRASLCEAHLPVVNELIQRYRRLLTYDYFAHEVSAWDVPIWYVKHDGACYRASLLRYKEWDRKPVVLDS